LCTHKEPAGGKPRLARGGEAYGLDKALLCKSNSVTPLNTQKARRCDGLFRSRT